MRAPKLHIPCRHTGDRVFHKMKQPVRIERSEKHRPKPRMAQAIAASRERIGECRKFDDLKIAKTLTF
jgi:hypothetical protein